MNKPYVVCYMMNSLDGRIKGDYFTTERGAAYRGKYADLHVKQVKKAWMCGTNTMIDLADEKVDLPKEPTGISRADYIADTNAEYYAVSIDPLGELAWKSNVIEHGFNSLDTKRTGNQIIEILTAQAPDAYLTYLQNRKISYIISGEENICFAEVFDKLYNIFGIDHLLLEGGGFLNSSVIREDLIDEYSVLMIATVDAGPIAVTSFAPPQSLPKMTPFDFYVKSVEKVDNTGLWMTFTRKEVN
ncbi:dihydrofolate reductase family protein [Extibacter muris]|uniref:dihydrofolate reductase family protein n=1 Tax=Extibacter muris TaxID=1796622 RepID=UPI001D07044E|nr:dihydrofolate reductase family protein [Extibacter muris]MCB6200958.1 dihydrofolate reductase family protein [Extibacter muris]MCQ4662288.1 dihydrofolate reductase family protein [Extibacter muris]MCQ4691798.1 dihydrofolate reductase family protein [Extibacter muris]